MTKWEHCEFPFKGINTPSGKRCVKCQCQRQWQGHQCRSMVTLQNRSDPLPKSDAHLDAAADARCVYSLKPYRFVHKSQKSQISRKVFTN